MSSRPRRVPGHGRGGGDGWQDSHAKKSVEHDVGLARSGFVCDIQAQQKQEALLDAAGADARRADPRRVPLFADAEAAEDDAEEIVRREAAGDLAEHVVG